jgi:hypothetical protein
MTESAVPAGATPGPRQTRSARWLAVPLVGGAIVAVTLGLVARETAIDPGTYPGGYFRLFFSDPVHLKAWCATAVAALACVQLLTGAWIFRWLPWARPNWIPPFHRWTGRLAFALTLPVAYHCIFRLGFQETDDRISAHSFLGCAIFGGFAAKVLVVRMHRFPRWVYPVVGGTLFATLIAGWYTSAYWFLDLVGWAF